MTLKELYNRKEDIKDIDIPEQWKSSFEQFMFGQTCLGYRKEDGSIGFIYYYSDFTRWFFQNKKIIERDEKIDYILNNK